jgi:hypothetical protein
MRTYDKNFERNSEILCQPSRSTFKLNRVLYVPDIETNLINIPTLDDSSNTKRPALISLPIHTLSFHHYLLRYFSFVLHEVTLLSHFTLFVVRFNGLCQYSLRCVRRLSGGLSWVKLGTRI